MHVLKILLVVVAVIFSVPFPCSGQNSVPDGDIRSTVLQCISYAPALKELQKRQEAAVHEHRSAVGGYLPQLDAVVGYGGQQYNNYLSRSDNTRFDVRNRFETGLTLTQLIWDGQGQIERINREEARIEAADNMLLDGAEQLGLEAVVAHMYVVRQKEMVTLADEHLDDHIRLLASLEERLEAGIGSLADVTQTKARLARAEATLADQRDRLTDAAADYERLTGRPPSVLFMAEPPEAGIPVSLTEAVDLSIENNPRLAAGDAEVRAADNTVGVQSASFFPEVYVEGATGYNDNVDNNPGYTADNRVMLMSRWNLFNGGSDWADREAALARKIQSKMNRRNVRDMLVRQVRSTWSAYETARRTSDMYAEAVALNTETRDMYLTQFDVGQRSLLDVLDVENDLYTSAALKLGSDVDAVIAAYKLLALRGGLMNHLRIPEAAYMKFNAAGFSEDGPQSD